MNPASHSDESDREAERVAAGNFKRNLFWNYFSGSVSMLSLLVFYPIGVHLSTADHFGLWVLIFSGTLLLSATDFGLGDGVIRILTRLRGDRTPESQQQEFVTVALSLFGAMAVIVIIIYAIALPLYLTVLPDHGLNQRTIHYALVAGGISLLASVAVRATNAVLWSLNRQDIERKSAALAVALRGAAYLMVWVTGGGFIGVMTADVIASLLPALVCVRAVFVRFGWPRFTKRSFREYVPNLLGLSVPLFIGSIASILQLQLPLYIVGAHLGLAAATAFGALMRVYQSCQLVNSWMANPFIHGISIDRGRELVRSVSGAHLFTLVIGGGMAVALAGLGDALIVAWMGPAFAFAGAAMAAIALGAIGDALTQPSKLVINLRGRPLWTALLGTGTLIAVLIGCVIAQRTEDLFVIMVVVTGIPLLTAPLYLLIAAQIAGGAPLPLGRRPFVTAAVLVATCGLVLGLRWVETVLQPWPAVLLGGAVVGIASALGLRSVWRGTQRPLQSGAPGTITPNAFDV